MRRFLVHSFFFALPWIAVLAIELFVLPIDFFTFRIWEAVVVKECHRLLPGAFYPNMTIAKTEERDLSHHTSFGEKRRAVWILDRYGYRKRETGRRKWDVVIVGDSNIAGLGLSQDEMLSEVLEEKLGRSVYPLAPTSLNTFLRDQRFLDNPPAIVIVASIEREITNLPSPRRPRSSNSRVSRAVEEIGRRLKERVNGNRWSQVPVVLFDRLYKMNMLHSVRASLRRIFPVFHPRHPTIPSSRGPIFFLQGPTANQPVSKKEFDGAVRTLKAYHDQLEGRGIRFIFLPIPNKENMYHTELRTEAPVFLPQLVSALRESGIETVDTQKAFENAFRKDSVPLYRAGDTHWNERGVRLAADLIQSVIERIGRRRPPA